MSSFFSTIQDLENSSILIHCDNHRVSNWFFFTLVILIAMSFAALPIIHIDVSVSSRGMIRPAQERAQVRSALQGTIDTIFFQEGSLVEQGAVIMSLKDEISAAKNLFNQQEMNQYKAFIHDLQILTSNKNIDTALLSKLLSPLYRAQSFRFIHHSEDQELSLQKANKEERMNNYLFEEKVISAKEFFDSQIQRKKTSASLKAFVNEQWGDWQQDLIKYGSLLAQCESRERQIAVDAARFKIKSPVAGTLQGVYSHYAGDLLQANEAVCYVSPEGNLIAECFVSGKDIGLIKKDQKTYFQVDAFDYNYFGSVSGRVIAIDNDYTLMDGQPFFRVCCSFDAQELRTKNKLTVQLKKGLGFQARFIIARRSIWQLLFDNLNDWLNPLAP